MELRRSARDTPFDWPEENEKQMELPCSPLDPLDWVKEFEKYLEKKGELGSKRPCEGVDCEVDHKVPLALS